ncbi:AmmeMemoRadiSam system radical SAM enzyme [Breoghania sp. L-A4]|uniref:AmmeMemoRadiSam system radical SAM enzyme n=1 Tax=Breoghania sp. L-A4 TaxID=2304600 RepID=UPI000E35AEE0|nr:AmmeMemoRadiSam system radical SAM enzyme [Breoghania sp. L-A4]AXS41686.1 AmmeMemoRadiSam system radical SAM enzyme [Breoghania sp. L-A4]
MNIIPEVQWTREHAPADFWQRAEGTADGVVCKLSPRNCRIAPGKMGKCGVRGNVGGELRTFNYGKSVEATMEFIETEAVYHYRPGARILSLGNIGCMMSCDFCQNWKTSQVRHLNPHDVKHYSPEQIVETCLATGIGVISWTYNDPVVWHEFVVETSRLAQAAGIRTLYKSAFYIEEAPVDELIGCIDIFSISLKSMDDRFYRKFTGGTRLQPVLDRIKQVHASGRHLEISQLIITGRNDNAEEIGRTNDWVLENLGDRVPLHYVGFHPAYLYVNTTRTDPEILLMAQHMARQAGIRFCYVGNTFKDGVSDTRCASCGGTLVRRYGLDAEVVGIARDNTCMYCGAPTPITEPHDDTGLAAAAPLSLDNAGATRTDFTWVAESQSAHIEARQATNGASPPCAISVTRLGAEALPPQTYTLGGALKRIIVSKQHDQETGIAVQAPPGVEIVIFPVLDRAHFPTSTELSGELRGYRDARAAPAAGERV